MTDRTKEAAHTPGPWSVFDNPNGNYGCEVIAITKVKAKRVVCRVGGPDRVANARLIAAAPDLLEVVRRIAGGERSDDGHAAAREAARAALSAATGGAS